MLVASEVLAFIAISSHLHRTISGLSAECEMSMFYIVVLERAFRLAEVLKQGILMVRLSSYTILSNRLSGGGYALMNGCTGAIDLVAEDIAQLIGQVISPLSSLDAYLSDEALGSDLVEYLLDRGHLTKLQHEQEREHVKQLAQLLHTEAGQKRPPFLIVPSMDCNYRCSYCFERPLQNELNSATAEISHVKGNVVMGKSQVKAVFSSIETIQKQIDPDDVGGFIVLYGGEPLNAANKEIVFEIVETGISKGYFFGAISNGHDLDTFLPLLGQGKIDQVQVSIDGPKRIHDKRRISLSKESSFDRIITNVTAALAQTDVEIQIRVHVDPSNIELFDETLAIFAEHGWLNHNQVVVYANTVYEKDKGGNVSARIDNEGIVKHLQTASAPYQNVYISAAAVHASRSILPALENNKPYQLSGTYCGANTGMYIFAPDEFIYACWESIGKACSRIGSYQAQVGLTFDQAAVERWFSRSVAKIPECLDCPYALACGGGCAQYAEYNTGSPYKPYCDDFQQVFRTALADNVEGFLSGQTNKVIPKTLDSQLVRS
jgi:uncharacterized protein